MKGRKSRIDMSSEGGRYLLRDMIQFKKTGFNPFIPKKVLSEKFWKSRKVYEKVSFGAFKAQAEKMRQIAIAQMPKKERMEEENRLKLKSEKDKKKKLSTPKPKQEVEADLGLDFSKLNLRKDSKSSAEGSKSCVRDTIVAKFPNGKKALVIFQPDGDVDDEAANKLEFSGDGTKIVRWARVPKEWLKAAALIGNSTTNESTDGDCMLLAEEIKKRMEGIEKDEFGSYWEPREVIELPFSCHRSIFNKYGDTIPSYLLRKNSHDFAWGYFWLLSCDVDLGYDSSSDECDRIFGESESWDYENEEDEWDEDKWYDDEGSIEEGGYEDMEVEVSTEEQADSLASTSAERINNSSNDTENQNVRTSNSDDVFDASLSAAINESQQHLNEGKKLLDTIAENNEEHQDEEKDKDGNGDDNSDNDSDNDDKVEEVYNQYESERSEAVNNQEEVPHTRGDSKLPAKTVPIKKRHVESSHSQHSVGMPYSLRKDRKRLLPYSNSGGPPLKRKPKMKVRRPMT